MADTTKIYENIFIKKNAAGDREYIKVPYAILADPPTIPDVSGFMPKSGGTFTGNVTFPTVPKVGSSSLALKSEIPTMTFDGTTLTINL